MGQIHRLGPSFGEVRLCNKEGEGHLFMNMQLRKESLGQSPHVVSVAAATCGCYGYLWPLLVAVIEEIKIEDSRLDFPKVDVSTAP